MIQPIRKMNFSKTTLNYPNRWFRSPDLEGSCQKRLLFSGALLQVPAYFPPDAAEKAPDDGSSISTGTSSYTETGKSGRFLLPDSIRKQEESKTETCRKSTFPFRTWPEKFVSQPDVTWKYRFPSDADKIIRYFLGNWKTNTKNLSKSSVRLSSF